MACAICGKTYRYRRSLNFHLRKFHGLETSECAMMAIPGQPSDLTMNGTFEDLHVVSQENIGALQVVDIPIERVDVGVAAHEEVVHGKEAAEDTERTSVQMVLDALGSNSSSFQLDDGSKEEQVEDEGNVVVYMCEVRENK